MWEMWLIGGLVVAATIAVGAMVGGLVTSRSGSLRALALGLSALALLVAACNDGGGGTGGLSLKCPSKEAQEAPADLASLSLDEVYKRMAESMTCPGYVLHVTSTQEGENIDPERGKSSLTGEGDTWLDFPGGRARADTWSKYEAPAEESDRSAGNQMEDVSILVGDTLYGRGPGTNHAWGNDAHLCPGTDSTVVSLVVGCGSSHTLEARFEPDAEYEGRHMPALVMEGESVGSDETIAFVQNTYLDETMLLPVAGTKEATSNGAPRFSFSGRARYDFVPLNSLPEDLFDPAAIGYMEPDPEEQLRGADLGIDVYWLGRDFPGTAGLPALSLDTAQAFASQPDTITPGYRALLEYRLASERFSYGIVGLQVFPRSAWDAYSAQSRGSNLWDASCVQKTEMNLDDRQAVIFGTYESSGAYIERPCPEQSPENWGAYVYVGDTVVLVSTWGRWKDAQEYVPPASWKVSQELVPSPYASREGMEAIVRGLVPRPPDQ
jgi:hypothetical protein